MAVEAAAVAEVAVVATKNATMAVADLKVQAVADAVANQINKLILKCCFRISNFEATFLVFRNWFSGGT